MPKLSPPPNQVPDLQDPIWKKWFNDLERQVTCNNSAGALLRDGINDGDAPLQVITTTPEPIEGLDTIMVESGVEVTATALIPQSSGIFLVTFEMRATVDNSAKYSLALYIDGVLQNQQSEIDLKGPEIHDSDATLISMQTGQVLDIRISVATGTADLTVHYGILSLNKVHTF